MAESYVLEEGEVAEGMSTFMHDLGTKVHDNQSLAESYGASVVAQFPSRINQHLFVGINKSTQGDKLCRFYLVLTLRKDHAGKIIPAYRKPFKTEHKYEFEGKFFTSLYNHEIIARVLLLTAETNGENT